jgi:hypothetical protein
MVGIITSFENTPQWYPESFREVNRFQKAFSFSTEAGKLSEFRNEAVGQRARKKCP